MEYKIGDIVKVNNKKGLVHCNEMIKISKIGKNPWGKFLIITESDITFGTLVEEIRPTTTIKFGG